METVEIEGVIKRRTSLAVLFFDGDTEEWVPESQILDEEELEDGLIRLEVPHWLALDKGFI